MGTIFITGASSGIGKATAKYFQNKGWNVVATMRSPEKEEELNQLENVLVVKLDVVDKASIQPAIEAGIEKFGQINVLLNNAGYGALGPLEATTDEKIKRIFDVNVMGLLNVTKAMLPHFRKNKNGVVINISSMAGKVVMPMATLYHGTKFAVEGITESLNFEMEQFGGKAKIIEPGAIKTDFSGRSFDFSNDETLKEYQSAINNMMQAMGGMMNTGLEPEVVSEIIFNAATDESCKLRYIAGDDAVQGIEARAKMSDEEHFGMMKKMLNI